MKDKRKFIMIVRDLDNRITDVIDLYNDCDIFDREYIRLHNVAKRAQLECMSVEDAVRAEIEDIKNER